MRFKKATKKELPRVTLTEAEVVEACYQHLTRLGYQLSGNTMLIIKSSKTDKAGRRRKGSVEFSAEFHEKVEGDRSYEVFT